MSILNEFRIERCFSSMAGPVWICRQIFECHEEVEKINKNVPLAFWRNDLPRKDQQREPGYYVCWEGAGSQTSGIYLMLFPTSHLPWIGHYGCISHMERIELVLDITGEIERDFDPERARLGQTFAGREVLHLDRFFSMYPGIQTQLVSVEGT